MPEENVKVAVRVRPFNRREKERNATLIIAMNGASTTITDPTGANEEKKFTFDYSYWSHDGCKEESSGYWAPDTSHGNGRKFADQKKVYEELGVGVLNNAWEGYNSTLFAYGQTGSGKSWSMVGYGPNKGIVPLYCNQLFTQIEEKRASGSKEEFEVTFSMLEIYNEAVRDLLDPQPSKSGLKVRQHPKLGFYADGLKTVAVANYAEIEKRMEEGTTNRTVASTKMNATSSRAHTIVGITFVQKSINAAGEEMAKTAICNLVDLAGSERADSTGATGDRLKEGAAINQSLSCLGNCIAALADRAGGKNTRVPYRDSCLTKLLKNALGGNSKTIMIAALSPADINYDETLSTLRYADRAKQIKTSAKINEDPTAQLIRELQEENEKLKAMLASGKVDMSLMQGDDDDMTEDEKNDMKKELEAEYASMMEKNQKEMEEMQKTFEQRLKEAQDGGAGADFAAIREKQKTVPHLYNLNSDPLMSGRIIHFIEEEETILGSGKDESIDLVIRGVSIKDKHCIIWMKDGVFTLETLPDARTLRNGKSVTAETKVLKHNDRLMLGTSLFYVFSNPKDAAQSKVKEVTYELAQEEIASKSAGIDMSGKDKGRDELILQQDLLEVVPAVQEANGDAETLGKHRFFEMVLVPAEATGQLNSRSEVMIRMTDTDTRHEWMWSKGKFMDRKCIMAEMEDKFQDGEEWDLPKDKDPFYDDPNAPFMIGSVQIWMQSLAYMIESKEQLTVIDYKGTQVGMAQVNLIPCDSKGKEYTEKDDVVADDPKELLGKDIHFKIKVVNGRGFPAKYTDIYCKYMFYLDENWNQTKAIPNTSNPDWNYEKLHSFPALTEQALEYLKTGVVILQVWGKQKDDKKKGVAKVKSILGSKASIHAVGSTEKKFDPEKMKYMLEVATLKKRQEKMEQKLAHLKKMLEVAEQHKKKKISTKIVNDVYHASTADQAEKCIALIPMEKDSDSSSSSSSSSSDEEKKKKKAAAGGTAVAVVNPTPKSNTQQKQQQQQQQQLQKQQQQQQQQQQKAGKGKKDRRGSYSSSDEEKKKKSEAKKLEKPVPAPRKKSAKSNKGNAKSSSCLLL